MCHIKKRTQLSELLQKTTMVIWDEATMTDRRCFECVDRSFRDILGERSKLFGGMSMLLGGDFRQTLPVKRKKSHQDVMASTLPNSYLWPYFTVYKLSFNMRLSTASASDSVASSPDQFAGWLLDIGNGLLGTPDLAHPESTFFIRIPDRYLVMDDQRGLQQLIDFVYSSGVLTNPTPESLRNRAIVCPKNTTTDEINRIVLDMAYGQIRTYSSNDSITPHTSQMSDLELLYPQEYLNQLTFPGLPLHSLQLKKNVPVVLLRNMNQKNGLCNGTRLIVTELLPTVIEATIITGPVLEEESIFHELNLFIMTPNSHFFSLEDSFPADCVMP